VDDDALLPVAFVGAVFLIVLPVISFGVDVVALRVASSGDAAALTGSATCGACNVAKPVSVFRAVVTKPASASTCSPSAFRTASSSSAVNELAVRRRQVQAEPGDHQSPPL
jgi:hypothetical protein